MKVFSVDFQGVYPVGAVALVVAPNNTTKKQAAEMFNADQAAPSKVPVLEEDVTEIDITKTGVTVLLDGDY